VLTNGQDGANWDLTNSSGASIPATCLLVRTSPHPLGVRYSMESKKKQSKRWKCKARYKVEPSTSSNCYYQVWNFRWNSQRPRIFLHLASQKQFESRFQISLFGVIRRKSEAHPPPILLAHMNNLEKVPARYIGTRIVLKHLRILPDPSSFRMILSSLEPSRSAYFSRG
jgi:hypothetical protein